MAASSNNVDSMNTDRFFRHNGNSRSALALDVGAHSGATPASPTSNTGIGSTTPLNR